MNPPACVPAQVVYLPSCVTRMMGPAASDTEKASVHEKLLSVFGKAGYEVIYPEARSDQHGCDNLAIGPATVPLERHGRGTAPAPCAVRPCAWQCERCVVRKSLKLDTLVGWAMFKHARDHTASGKARLMVHRAFHRSHVRRAVAWSAAEPRLWALMRMAAHGCAGPAQQLLRHDLQHEGLRGGRGQAAQRARGEPAEGQPGWAHPHRG